jgi:hypothetical protein
MKRKVMEVELFDVDFSRSELEALVEAIEAFKVFEEVGYVKIEVYRSPSGELTFRVHSKNLTPLGGAEKI